MLSVFQVLSGENWNDLLTEGALYLGPWAIIYFMMLLIMANWIILNLFIAILLSNINELSIQEQRTKARVSLLTMQKFSSMKRMAFKKDRRT